MNFTKSFIGKYALQINVQLEGGRVRQIATWWSDTDRIGIAIKKDCWLHKSGLNFTEKKVPAQLRSVGSGLVDTWAVLTETIRQSGRNERPTTILAAAGLRLAANSTTDNSIGRVIVCLVDLRLHRPDLLQLGGRRRRRHGNVWDGRALGPGADAHRDGRLEADGVDYQLRRFNG